MSTLRIGNNVVVPVLRVPIGIPRDVDSNGVYGYPTTPFTFNLPSTATKITNTTLREAFNECTTIVGVNMASVTEISGTNTLENFCYKATNLTSLNMSGVTTISDTGAMDSAFYGTGITSVDLSSLQTVSGTAMTNTFANCPYITSINGTAPMRNIFGKRDGIVVSFPAFNSSTFGQQTTYLDNIVSGAVGATVHFPSNMQSIIGSWSSVQNGFGGTNNTVLFDLPATE